MPIGERIGMYRRRRGLSQLRLGGLINRSEDWVSKVERGEIPIDRLSVLISVAGALQVTLADLLRDHRHPRDNGQGEHHLVVAMRQTLIRLPTLAGGAPRPLEVLAADLDAVNDLRQGANYTQALAAMPKLLTDLQTAAAALGDDHRTMHLLGQAYGLAAILMSRFARHDLAWIAADRAVTLGERTGRPDDQAHAAFRLSHVLLGAGRLDEAIQVAEAGLTRSRPHLRAPRVRCLAGAMHLPMAIAAARKGDRGGAFEALDEATARTVDPASKRVVIPRDLAATTQYGPANVQIHQVSVAVDLGDAGDALRIAERIPLGEVSDNRRSRHLIDVALAHNYRRDTEGMVAALLESERLAREQIVHFPLVREMVYDAVRRERGHANEQLHALVDRLEAA